MSSAQNPIYKTVTLHQPDLEEIASGMRKYLEPSFSYLDIDVIQCPDLKVFPYYLTAPGLCGDPEVITFGDYKHLYNMSSERKNSWSVLQFIYSKIHLKRMYKKNTSFVIGGGGIFRGIPNKEVVRNFTFSWEKGIYHESNYIFLNEEEQVVSECEFNSYPSPYMSSSDSVAFYKTPLCDIYGSFYVCNGEQNKVLKVCARGACDGLDAQILNMMRKALCCKYNLENGWRIGLSGLLTIRSGTVETAALQRIFPQTPLIKTEDIYKWNKRNISPDIIIPLVVHNIMFNFDNIKWYEGDKVNLKINNNSYILRTNELMGSRFLKSIEPCTVEFEGYFNVVSKLHCFPSKEI